MEFSATTVEVVGFLPMTLRSIVARNLRTFRVRRKLRQVDVAARTGISVSHISMMELGDREPTLKTLAALANALRVRPYGLLEAPRARGPLSGALLFDFRVYAAVGSRPAAVVVRRSRHRVQRALRHPVAGR
jgi:transcriptional regulator with XRE-family HTH domain